MAGFNVLGKACAESVPIAIHMRSAVSERPESVVYDRRCSGLENRPSLQQGAQFEVNIVSRWKGRARAKPVVDPPEVIKE
jgi:hypothetical protein